MFIMSAMTALFTGAVASYVRFLVGLCRECKPHWIGYWIHLRTRARHDVVAELSSDEYPISRAA